ncbi:MULTISPECIES: hypothetical protein [unclassified Tolypothrix]|uniref:hypothetical protein n=1 Tax=unclassified Tolypothrix TaxID=2649714 RepID=UPI0005EAB32B|nr:MULTISPECIES: hypothetical protein [unclassified Tolypothrix]BAY95874.1 hypothetical protein NIES3275_79510 [Microchaete diplosiphon NIES-3275]EKE96784.1 hypothetical protein FDUTEX481_06326 [Tolypothrix sp. PCC 7601]MBE9083924.1 hypothetical protein [Tolypothrix sp. LEGE 11397]UYD30989.1 hypothetical protein HGR01_39620 [Tolypothrix sp. PCC 7712]UYD38840.1 hypothetical protein HG267_40855 [Tolypothrix sp. PCC 7601]
MNYQPLPELVNTAQKLLIDIRQHPHFKSLNYNPDVTIGDACQALNDLCTEITESTILDASKFERFSP